MPWLGRPPCGTGDVQFFGRSPVPIRVLASAAAVGSRGVSSASAAGLPWLARPRQPAWAHPRTLGTHPKVRSEGSSAGGGGAESSSLRPGVARHRPRSRRDRGCLTSFSISAHSAGPTQSQTTARSTSSSPREFRRRYFSIATMGAAPERQRSFLFFVFSGAFRPLRAKKKKENKNRKNGCVHLPHF